MAFGWPSPFFLYDYNGFLNISPAGYIDVGHVPSTSPQHIIYSYKKSCSNSILQVSAPCAVDLGASLYGQLCCILLNWLAEKKLWKGGIMGRNVCWNIMWTWEKSARIMYRTVSWTKLQTPDRYRVEQQIWSWCKGKIDVPCTLKYM